MSDAMKKTLIADVLADAGYELSAGDGSACIAHAKALEIVKAAVPFLLPICVVTGHLPASAVVLENASEPYTGVLLRWLATFAKKPTLESSDLKEFISLVRDVSSDRISRAFEEKAPVVHAMLRKRIQAECDLCDEVMLRWLDSVDVERLYDLAVRWDLHQLRHNEQPNVLEELGLTIDSMLELPEAELIRLDLITRLEDERQRHLSEFWEFLGNDSVGVAVHRQLNDAISDIR